MFLTLKHIQNESSHVDLKMGLIFDLIQPTLHTKLHVFGRIQENFRRFSSVVFVLNSTCVTSILQWLSNLDSPLNFLSNEGSHDILWRQINILKIFRVCSRTPVKGVRVGTLISGPNPNFLIDLCFLPPKATPCKPSKLSDEIFISTSPLDLEPRQR